MDLEYVKSVIPVISFALVVVQAHNAGPIAFDGKGNNIA